MNITSGRQTRTVDEKKASIEKCGTLGIKLTTAPRTLVPAGVAVYEIPIDRIKAGQAMRTDCPPEGIAALAQSIHKYGVIHPLTVRTDGTGGDYELVSGHRRLRAVKLLGLSSVRCIVITRDRSYSDAVSLCENIHSNAMHYLDIAEGIGNLSRKYGYSIQAAASKLCLSEMYVRDMARLLEFSERERRMIRAGEICEDVALQLLGIDDTDAREKLISEIYSKRLDRTGAEELVFNYMKKRAKKQKNRPATYLIRDIRIFYNTIDRALEVMRGAGYPISAEKIEEAEHTLIMIRIPK